MKESKSFKIIAIAIVIAVLINSLFKILGAGLPYYFKDLKVKSDISVTGYHEQEFTSDLIVWEASFSTDDKNKQEAFSQIKKDREKIKDFLSRKGIKANELTFKATWDKENYIYVDELIPGSDEQTRRVKYFESYTLGQTLIIESNNVELVEKVCNEITDLIENDIDITSYAPKYYYTKLGDKKISTIEAASKNGLLRAETAVQGADGKLGELQETSIGVFQILGKNSDDEYSWGGTLNTSHKEKTISVNVKQRYEIK